MVSWGISVGLNLAPQAALRLINVTILSIFFTLFIITFFFTGKYFPATHNILRSKYLIIPLLQQKFRKITDGTYDLIVFHSASKSMKKNQFNQSLFMIRSLKYRQYI